MTRCSKPRLSVTVFHVIIPARFGSTRLPAKPLLQIGDRPLIQWAWQSAIDSGAASVLVATDDERIRAAAVKFGADCVMTSPHHVSGTDRIAETVRAKGFAADDIVVNLQGDEPMIPAGVVASVAQGLREVAGSEISTAIAPIRSLREFLDPNCVKALRARDGRALYFSRAPVPWPRDSIAAQAPGVVPRCMAPHRHLRLSGPQPLAVCGMAAHAARDDGETRAIARSRARHAHPPGDIG